MVTALVVSKEQDIFGLERYCRNIIQIRIASAIVVLKRGGRLQFGNILEEYYSNKICDSGCFFERGRTSADRE